jgi:predicted transcriptional regulator
MQKKTKGRKNYSIEAKDVADIANVSESYVKKVRTAEISGINPTTARAKIIIQIDHAAAQNQSLFIQKIKELVKFTA